MRRGVSYGIICVRDGRIIIETVVFVSKVGSGLLGVFLM